MIQVKSRPEKYKPCSICRNKLNEQDISYVVKGNPVCHRCDYEGRDKSNTYDSVKKNKGCVSCGEPIIVYHSQNPRMCANCFEANTQIVLVPKKESYDFINNPPESYSWMTP